MTHETARVHGVPVGAGRLAPAGPAALVLVDCQRLFLADDPDGAFDAAARCAGRALAHARDRSLPVVWLRVLYEGPDDLGPVWRAKAPALLRLRPGADEAGFDPRVGAPAPDEAVVTKPRASGFVRTDLDARLAALGVASVVVTGFTTAGCVRATAVDAASLDYTPLVLADAVADRSPAIHDAALRDLDARYADVVTLDRWQADGP